MQQSVKKVPPGVSDPYFRPGEGGNATVKERANIVIVQPGTLVHTRVSAKV